MFINAKLSSIRFISSYILALGLLVLSIPIYADKMNVAILTHISGTVEISNSADREADFGVDIYEGDIISTAKEGTFTLTFYNGCRQEQVKKNSSIKVGMSSSSIIKGGFSNINTFDCEVPAPQLGMDDSHKKAGITFRGADIDKEVKKIAYENKIVSSCVTNNSKKTIGLKLLFCKYLSLISSLLGNPWHPVISKTKISCSKYLNLKIKITENPFLYCYPQVLLLFFGLQYHD